MSYSLTAHSPWEGINLVFNGTNGRLEIKRKDINKSSFDIKTDQYVKIFNRQGEEITVNIPQKTSAGHGGSDAKMLDKIFRNPNAPDPLNQDAGVRAGMMSIGIGMAANLSMKEGRRVSLAEFYDELK